MRGLKGKGGKEGGGRRGEGVGRNSGVIEGGEKESREDVREERGRKGGGNVKERKGRE